MRPPRQRGRTRWNNLRLACAAVVLGLVTSLLGAPSAASEVEHPRQEWMRQSTAGLFLHWGMFTAPRHLDCAEWERDVTGGGWTPDYWVDEANKLGASYIVLATFHSRLGYARPWPSQIPGSCSTQRDILGELVQAGKAKGVRVILYMTDDPQWHNEQGIETLDSAAYSAYKGQQVDLTTRDGFGQFSYDNFFEVMENYPDLAGFWIDNDNAYWERNKLYEQIREKRPSWLLSNNNEDTPIMDTVSNEQKTGMTPSYDYPQAAWTPMPRLVEADYKLPTTGDWWFSGGDSAVDTRLSTGRYITNAGSSMKSLMAETPMVNGKFPPQQEAFNNFMAQWVPPIRESLFGTEGGGYMFGGLQPGFWNDGAHGVTTVKPGTRTQYVHVVTRPRTDFVRLRDNGYQIAKVTDLRTGERMRFSQSGGYLSILDVRNWDEYDTVFKVETAGRQGLYAQSTVRATATASAADHPASDLVDGSYESYWDSDKTLPVSVTLDLGKRRDVRYLALHQREWSPTYARESFGRPEDSARVKDFTVSVSDDGRRWREVRAGALPSARGVRPIDLGAQRARYVKLDVHNTWAGAQAPIYVNQLRIDEIEVGYGYPRATDRPLPLEAENASRSGTAHVNYCAGCSGSAAVTGLGRGTVTYRDVRVAEAGTYRLQLDHTGAGALSVKVNNAVTPVNAPAGPSDVPTSTAVAVPLQAGANTITVSGNGSIGLDRISVGPLPPESYTPTTTLKVVPSGLQWVGTGQQSIEVTATLRLDVEDALDQVQLAPVVPAGWTLSGAPATTQSLRLGQTLTGKWTLTSPTTVSAVDIPVRASFQVVGRAKTVNRNVGVRPLPAGRVFMREAEDFRNDIGSAGITNCSPCSGAQKVRNLGGATDARIVFPAVSVASAGTYTLFIDYTVNGTRSYNVSVNGGPPSVVTVSGIGNNTPATTSIPVTLQAGQNTITISNDADTAPDLDRISLG
ncbi:CBM35 domain-containing protein [Actinophytocola sp.]|uniref:CBM35 domain-containing protein n=1 Tax=Actinophytocola sp. TaxID=1872138 RepID=UPI002ED45170